MSIDKQPNIVYHVETSASITRRDPCEACKAPTADYVVVGKGQGRVKVVRLCRKCHTPEHVAKALAPTGGPLPRGKLMPVVEGEYVAPRKPTKPRRRGA